MASLTNAQLRYINDLMTADNTEGMIDGLYWTRLPGLFVQCRGNRASFIVRWNEAGRKRVMGLGSKETTSAQQAADAAERVLAQVKQGLDPIKERDSERAAAGLKPVARRGPDAAPTTFRDVTRAFLADRSGQWKGEATEIHFGKQMRDYVYPILGDVAVDKITIEHVVDVLKPLWLTQRPTANKIRSRIGQVLDWAEVKHWRSGGNPARSKAITLLLGSGKHRPRHYAAIHYSQLPAFWQKLAALDDGAADALRLQLLTAVRPVIATSAEWSEIDFENRLWIVPATRMKTDREHRVPLSDQAVVILERRKALAAPDARFVFPGAHSADKPLSRQVPANIIKRMGYNATAHGTARSSCREWATEVAGVRFEVAETILAHEVGDATVRAYQRSDLLGLRAPVMQQWADFLTSVAEQPAR